MTDQEKNSSIKTRFCPSPTGLMHLGNVRTALFNTLFAKRMGGAFLLRIEDTDKERSDERYTDMLKFDLQWLGLNWDEGPGKDEDLGPYHQSKRQSIYNDYYTRLVSMGQAYPCFCTEDELALMRKVQRASGKPPRYAGTCADMMQDQVAEKIAADLPHTLRFRVPRNETVEFDDLVRGPQRFDGNDIGDFIIRRTDGTSPFMFCNAVDDSLMEVSHVLRGEDHLTNTPRQIMILEALGLPIPQYGHIALIVGPDGSPLSKRHGSRSIQQLREEGFLSMALDNYLARLGHYYGHDDYLSLDELAEQFDLSKLSKSPAKFNPQQLNYWQNEAVAQMDDKSFWIWVGESIAQRIPEDMHEDFIEVVKPNVTFPKDVERWADILFAPEFILGDELQAIIKEAGQSYFVEAVKAYEQYGLDLHRIIEHLKTNLSLKGKALYQPLRIALTGEQHGPELAKLLALMDNAEIKRRLEIGVQLTR